LVQQHPPSTASSVLVGSCYSPMLVDAELLTLLMQDILNSVSGRSQGAEKKRSTVSFDENLIAYDPEKEQSEDLPATVFTNDEAAPWRVHMRRAEKQRSTGTSDEHPAVDDSEEEWQAEDLQASIAELRMQNHCLLRTVRALQEENATLCQKQSSMEQVIQDNIDLQRMHQEMSGRMMLLIEDMDHLKNQLSAERRRCADAEEQRCAQKKLFHRMFTMVKQVMDQNDSQQAVVVVNENDAHLGEHLLSTAGQHVFLSNNRKVSASELFAEDNFKDEMAHRHGMKTSSRFLLAEDGSRSAKLRREPTFSLLTLDVWS